MFSLWLPAELVIAKNTFASAGHAERGAEERAASSLPLGTSGVKEILLLVLLGASPSESQSCELDGCNKVSRNGFVNYWLTIIECF